MNGDSRVVQLSDCLTSPAELGRGQHLGVLKTSPEREAGSKEKKRDSGRCQRHRETQYRRAILPGEGVFVLARHGRDSSTHFLRTITRCASEGVTRACERISAVGCCSGCRHGVALLASKDYGHIVFSRLGAA